ncbi:MAG: integrin alpha, partial [Planctomycetota bacterium]
DLSAAEGDAAGAARLYRELAATDASNPTPLLRLAMMSLRTGDRTGGERLLQHVLTRWPDLAFARQQLARTALLERNAPLFLQHARHAVRQLRRRATPGLADSLGILRLGGLQGVFDELAGAGAVDRTASRGDDSVPLGAWLRPATVRGVEQVLRALATYDEATERTGLRDPRPIGVGLRSAWLTFLRTPQLMARLPVAAQLAVVVGIPCSLGRVTDRLTLELLPYERALGTRMHQIQDRRLFGRAEDEAVVYGGQLLRVGDLDGDTLDELLVTAPATPSDPGSGFVEIRSPADGALLRTWLHDDDNAMFGRAVASLGDVDGDLCADVLIGVPLARNAPGAHGAVELWSGRTGERLWRSDGDGASFGSALAALGDVDGDGVRDFVVGMSPPRLADNSHGLAFVCSGKDGDVLQVLPSERGGTWFGGAVANAGDANGDGCDDVVVGGNYGDAPGLVAVFDGRTGERLTTLTDAEPEAQFGQTVTGCGDLDGDGRAEVLVSAPGASASGPAGRVLVFSSRTGRTLYELQGERNGEGFGSAVQVLPLWQRQPAPVIAVGARGGGPLGNGYLRVFSLHTAAPVQTFAGNTGLLRFGFALADLGDRDGDGLRDLGVASLQRDGSVVVWSLSWADATPLPAVAPGTVQAPR